MVDIKIFQELYEGFYSDPQKTPYSIKDVNLDNIERYEISRMKEYRDLIKIKGDEIFGIIYKFTFKGKGKGFKRVGKTIDFEQRLGNGYISKARNHPTESTKINNFHRALQEVLDLMKQENQKAPIDKIKNQVFDYFKVEVYTTQNALDYNGFEDLLTLYENRAENNEFHSLDIQNKYNPIIGDLVRYAKYQSQVGLNDIRLGFKYCFEMGFTQEDALSYFKGENLKGFDNVRNELDSLNTLCKKVFGKDGKVYNLQMEEYLMEKWRSNLMFEIVSKEDISLIGGKIDQSLQKDVVFTTKDADKNFIVLFYGTEEGFGLIHSFQKYKIDFEQWGINTLYEVSELTYKAIKENSYEIDQENNMRVYQFKYKDNVEDLGVKLDQNGKIIEMKPYNTMKGYELFKETNYLNLKEI